MRYCPSCGAPVEAGAAACAHCGCPLTPEKTSRGSQDRGLKIAITAVACLWLITAGLWMFWPRLSQAAPVSQTAVQGTSASGFSQPTVAADQTPTPPPSAIPEPTAASPVEADPIPEPDPSPVSPPSPSPSPVKSVDKLELFTWWWGYLFLDDFQGENPVGKDVIQVWGYIGYTTDDRAFFEVYDKRDIDDETIPLISYYIDLHDDYLVPVIGDRDAWVLDRFLDQSDVDPLTLFLRDGNMKLNYHYTADGQSCDLFCMLVPED